MSYTKSHLDETVQIIKKIDPDQIEKIADVLLNTKVQGGRIFSLVLVVALVMPPMQLMILEK